MRTLLIFLFFHVITCIAQPSLQVADLTCELLENPLAIDNTEPHFNWIASGSENVAAAMSYQILVATRPELLDEQNADLWNSGKKCCDESLNVKYEGQAAFIPLIRLLESARMGSERKCFRVEREREPSDQVFLR